MESSFYMTTGLLFGPKEDLNQETKDMLVAAGLDLECDAKAIAEALGNMWPDADEHSVFYVSESQAVIQYPILTSYCFGGAQRDTSVVLDEEAEMGGELVFEMPRLNGFAVGTPEKPGRANYSDTADVIRRAKELYGEYLSEGYDYEAGFVFLVGTYY